MKSLTLAEQPNEVQVHEMIELYNPDELDLLKKRESLNVILNTNPPEKWLKKHPYIKDYYYLPIDKVEYLLKKIFKRYRIEITGEGTAFNGVYVKVRVSFLDPISGEWDWHEGIGAAQLQTKSGTSPSDLININNGAISMAFPLAKSTAIKDACDHLGDIFGANINRRDTLIYNPDPKLMNHAGAIE